MSEAVRNDAGADRYELDVDGGMAIAAYRAEGNVLVFTHTEVPEALEGRGIASRLIKGALDDIRASGRRIVPQCPFVAAYIERPPRGG